MKSPKLLLIAIAAACFALLGAALYLQFVEYMLPCPWCVIQRYLFTAIALICLITAFLPASTTRRGAGLGLLAALSGIGAASWHLWVKAHPSISCGLDPVETSLNRFPTAKLLPFLFAGWRYAAPSMCRCSACRSRNGRCWHSSVSPSCWALSRSAARAGNRSHLI